MVGCAIRAVKLFTYFAKKLNFFIRMQIANFGMNFICSTISISSCNINFHSTPHSFLLLIINFFDYISSHILQLNISFLIFFTYSAVNILKAFALNWSFRMLLLTTFTNQMFTWHYYWIIGLYIYWVFTAWTLNLFSWFKWFNWSF